MWLNQMHGMILIDYDWINADQPYYVFAYDLSSAKSRQLRVSELYKPISEVQLDASKVGLKLPFCRPFSQWVNYRARNHSEWFDSRVTLLVHGVGWGLWWTSQ